MNKAQQNPPLNVAVLMGGNSPEFTVSIASGIEVLKNLNRKKYNPTPVIVTRDGKNFQLVKKSSLLAISDRVLAPGFEISLEVYQSYPSFKQIPLAFDLAFIALHGQYGEDGTIQQILEKAQISYTGSGVQASRIGIDKDKFRKLVKKHNIKTPNYVTLKRNKKIDVKNILGDPPYFVKPNNQGSSVGTSLVETADALSQALEVAWSFSDTALIDEYIKGREITCALLGNEPQVLPLIEILTTKQFFDFDAKYTNPQTQEIVPASLNLDKTREIQSIAKEVFSLVGCRGFARVDFMLDKNETPYVLEINTIPGLTSQSLLPKAAKAQGISYPKLLDKIIQYAQQ